MAYGRGEEGPRNVGMHQSPWLALDVSFFFVWMPRSVGSYTVGAGVWLGPSEVVGRILCELGQLAKAISSDVKASMHVASS